MSKSKFVMPTMRKPVDPAALEQFASAADAHQDVAAPSPSTPFAVPVNPNMQPPTTAMAQASSLPWIGLDDTKRLPVFPLRLSAVERAKLKFLSEHSPDSMHEICVKACVERIDQLLKELPIMK